MVESAGVFAQAELEGGGFHTADAAEAPGGHDDLLNEEDFDGAERLVLLLAYRNTTVFQRPGALKGNDGGDS